MQLLYSWILLLYFDCVMRLRGFPRVHELVHRQPVRNRTRCQPSAAELSHRIDLACVFYFKPVLCLQRSATLTVLLRRHGWAAEMVIGAQLVPFQSHAWVEVQGRVVNDKPYISEIFQVLERC